jgi:acyl-CoA reductase-like NAD-dependent aldehyde dehydrogenase
MHDRSRSALAYEDREPQSAGLAGPGDRVSVSLEAVRRAQERWQSTPIRARLPIIRRARHLVAERGLALAASAVGGNACATRLAEKLVAEVLPLADACLFLERVAVGLLRPRRLGRPGRPAWLFGVETEVRREPFGVVLVVGPSNYPLLLPGVQAIQALAAGNAVVWKPGDGGSLSAEALRAVLVEAGLDPDLVYRLPESTTAGLGAIEGGVDRVVLTGSAETGRAVLAELAPRLVPATMELAGSDAVFVRPEADLDLVARALAFGLRFNAGASCIGPRRVFIDRDRAGDLERRLSTILRREETIPIPQATFASITEAISDGARLVSGWLADDGILGPVVLGDTRPDMPIFQRETFAPVLAVSPVADEDEALRAAGTCPFALGAAVFGDPAEARRLAGRIVAGVVVINDLIVPTADPRVPFGGRGRSGFGVTRGAEGLLEMTTVKVVATRRGRFRPHYEPTDAHDAELYRDYISAAHGATIGSRLAAGWRLVRNLHRWNTIHRARG